MTHLQYPSNINFRATFRNSGSFRTTSAICNLSNLRLLSKDMASEPKQIHNGFILHGISTLNQGESRYVKPVRMHFTLNGRKRAWDCLKAHDSVASVIYNKSRNKLIYVKQFRPAVYLSTLTKNTPNLTEFDPTKLQTPVNGDVGYTMELCAGIADKAGMTPQEIMREEIVEETGYDVPLESVKFINSFRGSTGLSGTLMNLFFTEVTDDQKVSRGGGVDDEAIEVMELDVEEARKAVYCRDEDAPYSRPPAMLFGTTWFLYEYLPKLSK